MTEFRDRIRHPQLRQLYTYWEERRGARRFPARKQIDPLDLKFALGNLTLVDVLYNPLRFRFRLVGTLLIQRLGMDLTGLGLDDIPDPAYRDQVRAVYGRVVETGSGSVSYGERALEGQRRNFEILRLPLAEDGVTIDMLLSCSLYFDPPPIHSPLGGPLARAFVAPDKVEDI